MPIFHHGYRRYEGHFTSERLRWLPIVRAGVALAWRGKLLRRVVLFAHLPLLYFGLVFLAIGKVTDPETDLTGGPWRELSNELVGRSLRELVIVDPTALRSAVWAFMFSMFGATIQLLVAGLMAAVAGPALIARDIGSRAFLLYFSRPISRSDYLLGKAGTLAVLMATVTLVPNLALYVMSILLSPSLDTILHTLPVLGAVILASLMVIVPATLVMLTLSSLTTQPRFAGAAWAVVCVFGLIFHNVLRETSNLGSAAWPRFFSFGETVRGVVLSIYDVEGKVAALPGGAGLVNAEALYSPGGGLQAALFLAAVCGMCIFVLYRRIGAPTRV